MRTLLDIFSQTLRTLWAHKLRSFLTMFGIAWGVGSLLLLAGVGEGFRNGNRRQLETFGKNIIFLFGGREMTRNLFPGRPAVGNTILLNGVRFEVIGMLSMIGNEEQNSTNIRIFVPLNTMRELFPLKGDNSKEGTAISFLNYQPRTFDE